MIYMKYCRGDATRMGEGDRHEEDGESARRSWGEEQFRVAIDVQGSDSGNVAEQLRTRAVNFGDLTSGG